MDKKIGIIIIVFTIGAMIIGVWLLSRTNNTPSKEITVTDNSASTSAVKKQYAKAPAMQIDTTKTYEATMETSKGTMVFSLFADETPVTVNNFVFLSQAGFYNSTVFHRIIADFMIQGGDPKGNGTGSPGYKFADEPITREYTRGILAMANSGPDTNGSQFFIMTTDTPLPKNYVIFGSLISGSEVLDAIAQTKVTNNGYGEFSKPIEKVTINKITIVER